MVVESRNSWAAFLWAIITGLLSTVRQVQRGCHGLNELLLLLIISDNYWYLCIEAFSSQTNTSVICLTPIHIQYHNVWSSWWIVSVFKTALHLNSFLYSYYIKVDPKKEMKMGTLNYICTEWERGCFKAPSHRPEWQPYGPPCTTRLDQKRAA